MSRMPRRVFLALARGTPNRPRLIRRSRDHFCLGTIGNSLREYCAVTRAARRCRLDNAIIRASARARVTYVHFRRRLLEQ